ncbi:MAG TPA: hypothetical protein VK509_01225, partial [Polyangiales bacterium]|nr:hypothetical protein [Polyangiales bacterium]
MERAGHTPDGGTDPIVPAPFPELLTLLEELRDDLGIGVDQLLSVQRLLARLAQLGELPDDPVALKHYLAPIVCRSREEQQLFGERFDDWARSLARRGAELPSQAPRLVPSDVRALRRRKRTWIALGGALALGCALWAGAEWLIPEPVRMKVTEEGPPGKRLQDTANSASQPSAAPARVLRSELIRVARVPVSSPRLRSALELTAFLLLLLIAIGRGLRAWYEARRFLSRDAGALPDGFETLALGVDVTGLADPGLRPLATALRQREASTAEELDVAATVQATARKAGVLTPVRRARRRLPDYLALIERESAHDVQAGVFDHWLEQLRAQDVPLARYFFARDPQQLIAPAPYSLQPLGRVQALTRDHRVLIFSDGRHFFSPLNGHPRASVDELQNWPARALFTPEPEALWAGRERALLETGLGVLPATAVGLAASRSVSLLTSGAQPARGVQQRPLPRFLAERERVWLHADAPAATEIAQLLSHLRAYLGPELYEWLAACALYPQLRWQLTAGLGAQLRDASDQPLLSRPRLLALARLPFMRASFMPDWLRSALLESLPRPRLEAARTALRSVLVSAFAPGKQALVLELARRDEGPLLELWRALLAHVRKRAPEVDPVHDRVFLKWMSDRRGIRMPSGVWTRLRAAVARATAEQPTAPGWYTSVAGAMLMG